jgi:hypothetical protein
MAAVMLNLNHHSGLAIRPPDFADKINTVIDQGILARRAKEPPRKYLGASLLGDPCTRRLVYIATQTAPDEELTPQKIRIFDVGHTMEDFLGGSESDIAFTNAAARWFHDAGFNLRVKDSKGRQFGWEAIDGKIQGHIDGVILDGPPIESMHYPALLEIKSVNKKSWSRFKKHGVRIASDLYFGQMQLNMAYLDVFHTVFTAINKDTSELTHELIEFDPKVAQRLSDRALEVVTMASKGELPERIASQSDYFICRMCSYYRRCWSLPNA